MRKNYLVLAIVLILFAAGLAMALPLIEKGWASLSQTDNTSSLDSTLEVFAERTDEGRDSTHTVSIPHVVYKESNDREYWYPTEVSDSITGELRIKAIKADSYAHLRVMVNFEKQGTWMLIESITLTISPKNNENALGTYTIYDSVMHVGVAGKPTDSIELLRIGTYDFTLTVKYKQMLKNDPRPYHGDNMVSTVIFLANDIDPMDGYLIELVKDTDEGEKGYDILYEDTVSSTINNPFEKLGYTFSGWYADSDRTVDRSDISYQKLKDEIYTDTKLYAKWTKNILTVTYSDETEGTIIEGYPENPVPVKEPTGSAPSGKTFRHWINNTKIYHPGDDLRTENTSGGTLALTAVYESKYAFVESLTGATVSITASESGSSPVSVFKGERIILTFTPSVSGHSLKRLTITGVDSEDITQLADNKYSFISVGQDMTITAVYEMKYTVYARDISGATLSMTSSFFSGDTVELNFKVMGDAVYNYVKVYQDGSTVPVQKYPPTYTKFTFVAGAYDAYVDAVYDIEYTVTVNIPSGGTVTANKSTAFAGDTITLTVTPTGGYALSSLTYTVGGIIHVIEGNTFVMPEGDVAINATFAPLRTVTQGTVTGATLQSISPSSVLAGETVTLTFTPNSGYEFVSLSVKFNDGQEKTIEYSGSNNVYTFTAVDYNMVVDAVYEQQPKP